MTKREKGMLLGGLLLIWGTLMFVDGLEQEEQQYQAPSLPAGQGLSQTKRGPNTPGIYKPLQAIALNKPRNIFAPLRDPNQPKPKVVKQPSKPPPPPPKPQTARPAPPRPQPTRPSPNDLAAKQAQQQLKKYQFLGYLTKEGEQQIFLSNGQAIYIVKQGETLEGDIQVKSIEPTSVVLSKHLKSIGETVEATLPLTKDGKNS